MLNSIGSPAPSDTVQFETSSSESKTAPEHTQANTEHLARKQIHTNSCGACSLLVAAKELGVEDMPGIPNMKTTITDEKLSLSNTCEEDIYMITSGSTSYRTQQKELSKAGYSMPQGIVTASRLLGLDARVTKNGSIFTSTLSYFYPQVEQECRGMNAEVQKETPEDAGAYRMRAVAVSLVGVPAGLHWVVMRPDGSYMDPGTGMNAANFDELNANAKKTSRVIGYYDTGISVVLDNSELKKRKTNDPDKNDAVDTESSKKYQRRDKDDDDTGSAPSGRGANEPSHQSSSASGGHKAFEGSSDQGNKSTQGSSKAEGADQCSASHDEQMQGPASFHDLEALKSDSIPNTLHNLQYFEEKLASESPLSPEESRAMIDTAHYALFLPDKDEYYHSKETPAAKEIRNSGLSLLCQALDKGHRSEVISLLNGPRGNNSRFEVLVDRMYSDYRDRKESTMPAFMQDIVQLASSGNPKLNLLGSSGKAKHGALATIYRHSPSRVSNSILLLVPIQDKKQLLQSIGSPSLMSRLLGEGADLKKKIEGDLARKPPKTTKPVSSPTPYALTQSKVEGMIQKEDKRLTAWREEKAKKENTKQVQIEALKSHGLSQSKAERVVNGISELSADAQTDALRKAVKSHVKEQEQKAALDARVKQQDLEYSMRRKAQYAEAERQASIRIAEQEQRQAIATQTRLREIEAVQAQRSLEMVQQYEFRQAQKKALQQNTNASAQSVNHRSSVERGFSGNRLSFNQTRSIAQDATRAIGTEVGSTLSQHLSAQQLARVSSNGVANIVPQLRDTVRFSEARGYDASGKLLVEGRLPHGSFAQLSNTNHLLMEETRGVAKPGSSQVLKSGSFPGQMTVHESGLSILPPRNTGDRVQLDIVRGGVRDNAVYPAQSIHFSREVKALSQLIGF